MAGRGDLIADTYRIPTQGAYNAAGQAAVQPGSQPYDDGLAFEKNLEEVEGKTKAYYEKVAALKSFMLDMHRNRGIDVRVPDLAHPESIGLNQIYQRGLADIMHQGNLLQQGELERKQITQRGDVINPSGRGKASSELKLGKDVMGKEVPANIMQVNDLLQQPSYDDGDYRHKQDVYNSTKKYIEDKIKSDPDNANMYNHWLSALTPPSQAIRQFAPQRANYQERAHDRKVEASGSLPIELTHIFQGVNDNTKVSPTTTNPNNTENPLLVSPNFKGALWNGKKIKEWGHDPKTKETFLFFDDGTSEDVTKQNPMAVARVLLGANKTTFGFDEENIEEWADRNGYLDKTGQFNQNAVLRKDAAAKRTENENKMNSDKAPGQVKQLRTAFSNLQNETAYLIGNNPKIEVKLDVGTIPAKIVKGSTTGKLHIDNFEKVFSAGLRSANKAEKSKWLDNMQKYGEDGVNAEEMSEFLQQYGAAQNLSGTTPESAQAVTSAVKSKIDSTNVIAPGKESMQERVARLKREAQEKNK